MEPIAQQPGTNPEQVTKCIKCGAIAGYAGNRPALCAKCFMLKPPPLMHQATGLARTVIDVVNGVVHGENPMVSMEERNRRLVICYECDQYEKASGRCFSLPGKPGCGCKMRVKSILSAGKCPRTKW